MDQKYIKLLSDWNACDDAIKWFVKQETVEQAWLNCERGDWLLWIVARLEVNERKLFLAKGKTAKLVIYLMKDNRSIVAVEAAIAYGNGEIDKDELKTANAAAYAASADAAYAAYAASADAAYAAYVASAAYTAATYAAADGNAKKDTLLESANIVREIYTLEEVLDAIN